LKKSTIIKFFAGLLAIELIGMIIWIWPDLFVRIFRPTERPSIVLSDNTQLSYLIASPTEWLAPTLQGLHPTRFPVLFTGTWTSTVTLNGTATYTPTRIPISTHKVELTQVNPPGRFTSTPTGVPTSTPTYKPTSTRTPIPTHTSTQIPVQTTEVPTDTEVILPTDTTVPPTDTSEPPTDTPSG
jgi:hypothetical protein